MRSPENKQLIMNKFIVILLLLVLFCSNANGQRWISGQVTTCSGEPVGHTVVIVKGTCNEGTVTEGAKFLLIRERRYRGTITDSNGNYRLPVDSLHTALVFSQVGFDCQKIIIGNDSIINVVLQKAELEDIWIPGMRRRQNPTSMALSEIVERRRKELMMRVKPKPLQIRQITK